MRAAAFEQEAIIPFILKMKNIGIITPQTPAIPKKVSPRSTAAAIKATVLDVIRSEFRLNLFTRLLFKKLKIATPTIFMPNKNP